MQKQEHRAGLSVRQTILEINLSQLRKNFLQLIARAKSRQLLLVLKADAYGHSVIPVARTLEKTHKSFYGFALANIEEALELRNAGIKSNLLVLSGFQGGSEFLIKLLARKKISVVVSSLEVLQDLAHLTVPLNVHLKFNTGMNRLGISGDRVADVLQFLFRNPLIRVQGLMSHFAAGEDASMRLTQEQIKQFARIIESFQSAGVPVPVVHIENSSGWENNLFPQAQVVRVGLSLYGIGNKRVKPIARWLAQIYQVRSIRKGESIGYGPYFVAKKSMRMAILGVGYADGYLRAQTNRASVLIKGKRCRVVGAVSMDLMAVDVSRIKAIDPKRDRAVLLGKQGRLSITAEDLAKTGNTIPWEIMTSISRRVPRTFVDE